MDFNDIALPWPRPTDLGSSALVVIAVLLAACSEGSGPGATPAGEPMPNVAAGKWRISATVDGKGGEMSMDMCKPETAIDDVLITGLPGNGRNCKDRTLTKDNNASWRLHSVCNFVATGDRKADTVVTIDTHVTGDLKTRYHVESRQLMSAPMNGVTQQVIGQTGERIGDC
jgi:hypothetical protein